MTREDIALLPYHGHPAHGYFHGQDAHATKAQNRPAASIAWRQGRAHPRRHFASRSPAMDFRRRLQFRRAPSQRRPYARGDSPRNGHVGMQVGRAQLLRLSDSIEQSLCNDPTAAIRAATIAAYRRLGGPAVVDREFFARQNIASRLKPDLRVRGRAVSVFNLQLHQKTVGRTTMIKIPKRRRRLQRQIVAEIHAVI